MTAIGAAEEYEVVLENSAGIGDFSPFLPLASLEFSRLSWGRVESGISSATVTLAVDAYGPGCCPYPLHGWDQSIAIYRNGRRQWGGPVVGWRVQPDGRVEIAARDILAFATKAFIYTDRTFEAVNWRQVIVDLTNDIMFLQGSVPWTAISPFGDVDFADYAAGLPYTVDRTYAVAEMKSLMEAIADVAAEAGEPFSCGPYRVNYGTYGLSQENGLGLNEPARAALNPRTVATLPQVVVDCLGIAEDVFIVSSAAGAGGYQRIVNAALGTISNPLPTGVSHYSQNFTLQTSVQADPRWNLNAQELGGHIAAVSALVPTVTLEAMELTPAFGSMPEVGPDGARPGLDGLAGVRPGLVVNWGFDDDCWSHVPVARPKDPRQGVPALTHTPRIELARLVQLDVSVSAGDEGLQEVIRGHFMPWAELTST